MCRSIKKLSVELINFKAVHTKTEIKFLRINDHKNQNNQLTAFLYDLTLAIIPLELKNDLDDISHF